MSKTKQVAGKRRGKKTTCRVFNKSKRKGRKPYYIKKSRPCKKKSRKNMKRRTRALAKSIKKSKKLRGGGDPTPPPPQPVDRGVEEEKDDFAEPDRDLPQSMGTGPWLERT